MSAAVTAARPPADAAAGAARLARDVLVRCWLRETEAVVAGPGPVVVDLPGAGTRIEVEVTTCSPTGAHGIGRVRSATGADLDHAALADLLTREAAVRTGRPDHAEARDRVRESGRRLQGYAAARAREERAPDLPRWLLAEQDLLSGHPWHPMTKSRDGLADALDAMLSPEARGSFQVQWYAAAPEVGRHGGTDPDLPRLLRGLAGPAGEHAPADWLVVPAHPWQAASLAARPAARELVERGLLVPLGGGGPDWWATSSLRTVACPGAPVMLKLSMGLRVTNSRRENTRGEGLLAAHTARLVDAGLGAELAAAHPSFGLVLDRGWVGVDAPGGAIGGVGLETVVRDVPFGATEDVRCAGSVLDPRPDLAEPPVAELVGRTGAAHGLDRADAARLWLGRWLHVVVEPLLWLHGRWGIGLEAHLQNVLVRLGADGLPEHGWYRDNQGWYAAESAVPRLAGLLPDVGQGAPLVFPDALVTERVAYYLGVNHVLGVVAALAAATGVAEEDLLRTVRSHLRDHGSGPHPAPVAALLLDADVLPTKANLLTGVDGRDEVESPVATQSVYVTLPNPLREVQP